MNDSLPKPGGRMPVVRAPSGLLAAVVLAFALGGTGCSTPRDTRTQEERAQDQAVADRVRVALRADPTIFADHIEVSAKRGVVSLTGWVMSDPESREARVVAATVPGVQRVDNRLDIPDVTLER